MTLRLFVRQSFTQATEREQGQVQEVLNTICKLPTLRRLSLVTGHIAYNSSSFRSEFEMRTGIAFSPRAFREDRIRLLNSADAMIVVRTGLSESSAFEIAYNIYSGLKLPMFFAISQTAPIKTTLLQDLDDICEARYHVFANAEDLTWPLCAFLNSIKATYP